MLAIVFAILASVGFGMNAVFARLGLRGVKSSVGTAVSMLSSLVLSAVIAFALELDGLLSLSPKIFLWAALIGILNFPLGRFFNYISVNRVGASRATAVIASTPLFALLFAVAFLGERPSALVIVGTFAVIAGLVLVVSEA